MAPAASCCRTPATKRRDLAEPALTTVAWTVNGRTEYALGGQRVHRRRRGPVAARRARSDPAVRRRRAPGHQRATTTAASISSPPSPGSARRTGTPTRAALIVGITRGTTAAHIARAAVESIAYQVADLLDAVQRDSGIPLAELRVDGGAASNDLLMQFQADLLGVPVVRPRSPKRRHLAQPISPASRWASGRPPAKSRSSGGWNAGSTRSCRLRKRTHCAGGGATRSRARLTGRRQRFDRRGTLVGRTFRSGAPGPVNSPSSQGRSPLSIQYRGTLQGAANQILRSATEPQQARCALGRPGPELTIGQGVMASAAVAFQMPGRAASILCRLPA